MRDPFSPGSKVTIQFLDDHGELLSYEAVIHDVTGDSLLLRPIVEREAGVRVPPGSQLSLWQQREQERAIDVALVRLVENRAGESALLVTTRPHRTQKVDRRQFLRVDVDLSFKCGGLAGRVRNISGGGLLAELPAGSLKQGQRIEFEVDLPGYSIPLRLAGKVVRIVEQGSRQLVGVAFTHLSDGKRDAIMRYVFGSCAG